MINFARFSPEDEDPLEVPEVELEMIELFDENAIVLMPTGDVLTDKVDKSRSIVTNIRLLIPTIQKLPKSPYSNENYKHYILSQDNGEQIEVYLFPKDI